jgi:lipid-binding SYLF domain-containing protein
MRIAVLALLVFGSADSTFAASKAELNQRIQSLTAQLKNMQTNPAARIPAEKLAAASGIIMLDRTRGALGFGYHDANGVALARDAEGRWSPAGFVSAHGASLGPQIGGTTDFFVILLMSPEAAQALKQPVIDFGGRASGTGGTAHAGAEVLTGPGPVTVYSEHSGLYAGASITGASFHSDDDANAVYYGTPATADGVLFAHAVQPTPTVNALIARIDQSSR